MTILARDRVLMEYAQMLEQAVKFILPGIAGSEIKEEKESNIDIQMGILIDLTGSIKGKLVLTGMESTFQGISEMMYGMRLDGAMLDSFAGELGNMIGGNFSIELSKIQIPIDITAPTILKGNAQISGFRNGVVINASLQGNGQVDLYFLLDN